MDSTKEKQDSVTTSTETRAKSNLLELPPTQLQITSEQLAKVNQSDTKKTESWADKDTLVIHRVVEMTTMTMERAGTIADNLDLKLEDVVSIINGLPLKDTEQMSYLEALGETALKVSSLIDDSHPDDPPLKKLSDKYRFISMCAEVKADQLV